MCMSEIVHSLVTLWLIVVRLTQVSIFVVLYILVFVKNLLGSLDYSYE